MTQQTTNTTTTVVREDTLALPDDPGPTEGSATVPDLGDDLTPADRRCLRRAWTAGALPVLALFAWLLMAGRWAPFQRQFFDDLFDLQARAFLDGRWDVPEGSAGFEGFLIDGRTYIYFGPFPSLLRIPLFLVTDRFDGRLTTISMLLAMGVLTVAGHRLNLALRPFVRGAAPVSRAERMATAGLAVALLGGIPLWLASTATVFHEAILWGLALTIAALASIVQWLRRPTIGGLATATVLCCGAMASRQTLGLGLLAGLGLLFLVVAASRAGRPPTALADVPLGGIVVLGVVAFLACAVPNIAKFGNPVGPPIDKHIASLLRIEQRPEFLEANNGSYFSTDFVPTTLLQYSRPDAIDFRGDFPWVDFPSEGPTVLGDVVFDRLEWTSSVPVTMPALVVAAVPGVLWLVRGIRRRDGTVGLLALWFGTGAGAVGALTIGYVGSRYLGDMAPIVIVAAVVGLHVLLRWRHDRRAAVSFASAGLAVLLAFGVWVNLGLGIQYQRERGFNIPEEWRTQLFEWRTDLPGSRRTVIDVPSDATRLPSAADGTLAVVGDCAGLYERVGDTWYGIARGPGVGVYDVRVDLDALAELASGERAPLVTVGEGADATVVGLRRLDDGRLRADLWLPRSKSWSEGWPRDLAGEVTVRVVTDPRTSDTYVRAGRDHLNRAPGNDPSALFTVGRLAEGVTAPGVVDRYPGFIAEVPFDTTLCRDATGIG